MYAKELTPIPYYSRPQPNMLPFQFGKHPRAFFAIGILILMSAADRLGIWQTQTMASFSLQPSPMVADYRWMGYHRVGAGNTVNK